MLEAVNYYHKALHLGCCSSPRSAFALESLFQTATTAEVRLACPSIYSDVEFFSWQGHTYYFRSNFTQKLVRKEETD